MFTLILALTSIGLAFAGSEYVWLPIVFLQVSIVADGILLFAWFSRRKEG